jgi:hypothetical protein
MQLTTARPAVDSDLAGRLLNALVPAIECAGFEVADGSVSECGLVVKTPDGYLEVAFHALPEPPDAPDACWDGPEWNDPSRWTTEILDPDDYDAVGDWLEHVEDQPDYLTRFNAERDDASETPA